MPRNPSTGVFDRVSNSFSHPVYGTVIDPTGAESLFDDYDGGLNDFQNVDISDALVTSTGSTTTRDLANRFADAANVLDFGAVGDGVTDDTSAINAALSASGGREVYIPTGVYSISNTIGYTITDSIKIVCAPGAIIKAKSTFPVDAKLIQFGADPGNEFSYTWIGGKIDGSLRPARSTGAPDLMYISSQGMNHVTVDGVWFYSNEDASGTSGDGGFFGAEGKNYTIRNCIFQGCIDSGIYLSGDSTDTYGENAIIQGNTFLYMGQAAVVSKRTFRRYIATGNIIRFASVGISTAESVPSLPGTQIVISNNNMNPVGRGIDARWSDGAVICGNRLENYGISVTGTPVAEIGILLGGSSGCIVSDNMLSITDYVAHASSRAIYLQSRTIGGVTRNCTYNTIVGNNINTIALGISEENSDQDFNNYSLNTVRNASAKYSFAGANSCAIYEIESGRFRVRGSYRFPNTGLKIYDADSSNLLSVVPGSNLTADRSFTLTTGDADRTLDISSGNVTISTAGAALIDDADAAAQRTTLGLVIGTNVQAYDADLQALASNSSNGLWSITGSGTGAARTVSGTTRKITVSNGDGVSGNPTITLPSIIDGMETIVAASGVQSAALTGTTAETTMATIAIPANSLGPNGYIEVDFSANITNVAVATEVMRIRYGGTIFSGQNNSTGGTFRSFVRIQNRGATNSQVSNGANATAGGLGTSTGSALVGAIDSTASQNLTITFQLGDSTDSMTLERYIVKTCYVS